MIFLIVQNLVLAMADVVVDAMIAEAVRFERYVNPPKKIAISCVCV